MIQTLIDKQDTSEIVRDQIAAILASEVAGQMALATAAGKNPANWKLRVFSERSMPWEQFLSPHPSDTSPIVNVWYDNSSFDARSSNSLERQKAEATYNIDLYGYGRSAGIPAGGHIPGDREAAYEAQRALRLVRNILMSAEYTYLGLRGLVWSRWPQSATVFQPQIDAQQVQQIVGARLAMRVEFNEFSPQYQPEILELVSATVQRTEDGEIVLSADYDYTL